MIFLQLEFHEIPIARLLELDDSLVEILKLRFDEIKKYLSSNSPLSVVFLAGSSLEGILLGIAINHPMKSLINLIVLPKK